MNQVIQEIILNSRLFLFLEDAMYLIRRFSYLVLLTILILKLDVIFLKRHHTTVQDGKFSQGLKL